MVVHMMVFLAEKYARKYRIRNCRESTREPETLVERQARITLPYVAVEYIRSVEIEVNVDYD